MPERPPLPDSQKLLQAGMSQGADLVWSDLYLPVGDAGADAGSGALGAVRL